MPKCMLHGYLQPRGSITSGANCIGFPEGCVQEELTKGVPSLRMRSACSSSTLTSILRRTLMTKANAHNGLQDSIHCGECSMIHSSGIHVVTKKKNNTKSERDHLPSRRLFLHAEPYPLDKSKLHSRRPSNTTELSLHP